MKMCFSGWQSANETKLEQIELKWIRRRKERRVGMVEDLMKTWYN